ncbi:hypothetical protein G9A89_004412 [Geosiphon pyriformis]|nr:hypothetical protein G9A89_004412 [Geosiphon pyriformis]
MEKKEIKRITRPESHDCNECEKCQESIRDGPNECIACQFIFFEKFYRDFSSGNKEVDEIIKNPIYIPPNEIYCYGDLNYYEWIPWESLSNINEIARGGFGIIYRATWVDESINPESIKHGSMEYKRRRWGAEEVAIKVINTNSSEVFKELNIQRTMFINNKGKDLFCISSMYGITQNAETLEYGLVMPFAKLGDMRKFLSINFYSTSWPDKLNLARNIAGGLSQIHSSGMVHCDLHSGNILQYDYGEVYIGDLGLCQPVKNEATTTTEEKKIYGVIPYIPPEVLREEKFTTAGDIYSYGMLLWELATGKPPFYDCNHDHILIMAILNGQRPKITSPLIPLCIAEIIKKCWDVNPENRPTANEVFKMLAKLEKMYSWFRSKKSQDEGSTHKESRDEKPTDEVFTDEVFIDEEFSYEESKTVSLQFLESDKHLKEMVESDDSTTTIQSTTTRIHQGAVYTSRVLTLQMIDFSEG